MKNPDTRTYHAHGNRLTVRRVRPGAYVLRVDGRPAARWATYQAELREDITYFSNTGALPPPTGTSWA